MQHLVRYRGVLAFRSTRCPKALRLPPSPRASTRRSSFADAGIYLCVGRFEPSDPWKQGVQLDSTGEIYAANQGL